MSTYTKESLAALLNGREYGDEITHEEEAQARAAGLVVAFGYSDDNVEFRGALHEEVSCYEETTIIVSPLGVVEPPDRDERRVLEKFGVLELVQKTGKEIVTEWCKVGDYSWTYRTEIPHATFDVMEDGEKYCRGIVFALEDTK